MISICIMQHFRQTVFRIPSHYGDSHIHKWFPCCSHDFTVSSPQIIGLSRLSNNIVNWMWTVPMYFLHTSCRTSAMWRHWEVFASCAYTHHICHVTCRKRLGSCSRRGSIPIGDLTDFTDSSQPFPMIIDPRIPNKFPSNTLQVLSASHLVPPGFPTAFCTIYSRFISPLG